MADQTVSTDLDNFMLSADKTAMKTAIDLQNVNNTNDLDKPVSTAQQAALDAKLDTSEKGAANGLATLDGGGQIPIAQIPASVQGGITVIGFWDADTNSPDLSALTLDQGQAYQVSVAGSTNLNGETNWQVRDLVVWDDNLSGNYFKLDNTDDVFSVNSKTGAVTVRDGVTYRVGGADPVYSTVQSAIDAVEASGQPGIILLEAGTYTENLTISRPEIAIASLGGRANDVVRIVGDITVNPVFPGDVELRGFYLQGRVVCTGASQVVFHLSAIDVDYGGVGAAVLSSNSNVGTTIVIESDSRIVGEKGIEITGGNVIDAEACRISATTFNANAIETNGNLIVSLSTISGKVVYTGTNAFGCRFRQMRDMTAQGSPLDISGASGSALLYDCYMVNLLNGPLISGGSPANVTAYGITTPEGFGNFDSGDATMMSTDGVVTVSDGAGSNFLADDGTYKAVASELIYDGIDTEANILILDPSTLPGQLWRASDTKIDYKSIVAIDGSSQWQACSMLYDENTDTFFLPPTQDGQSQNLGQETFFIAYNDNGTGATALDPKVFMSIGSKSGEEEFQTVGPVVAGDISPGRVFGVNTTELQVANYGKVTTYGEVKGVNTSAWAVNDVLYVDPNNAGDLTNVEPQINAYIVGKVLKSDPTDGIIFLSSLSSSRIDRAKIVLGTQKIFLSGQTDTLPGGTFYEALLEDEGTVPTATETISVPDNSSVGASQDHISEAFAADAVFTAGLREGQIEHSVNISGGQEKIYLELYDADSDGNAIDSGISGQAVGDLGVRPVLVYETSLLDSDAPDVYKSELRGLLEADYTFLAGNRTRYHFVCEKIGVAGNDKIFTLYFGSDHDSFVDALIRQTFLSLSDTPNDYTGQAGKLLAVNAGENAVEFISPGGSGDMTQAVYDPQSIASDAFDRANMTGTQTVSTISDFDTSISTATQAELDDKISKTDTSPQSISSDLELAADKVLALVASGTGATELISLTNTNGKLAYFQTSGTGIALRLLDSGYNFIVKNSANADLLKITGNGIITGVATFPSGITSGFVNGKVFATSGALASSRNTTGVEAHYTFYNPNGLIALLQTSSNSFVVKIGQVAGGYRIENSSGDDLWKINATGIMTGVSSVTSDVLNGAVNGKVYDGNGVLHSSHGGSGQKAHFALYSSTSGGGFISEWSTNGNDVVFTNRETFTMSSNESFQSNFIVDSTRSDYFNNSGDGVVRIDCQRSANSAYSFLTANSGGGADLEFRLLGNGTGKCDGSWTGGGADYAICREWADGNPDNEDRIGVSVIFIADEKMRPAVDREQPDGVISATYAYLENSEPLKWKGKYLKDDFGRKILEDYQVVEWVEITQEKIDPVQEVLDESGQVIVEGVEGQEEEKKNHSYDADRIPEGITVPDDATYIDMTGKDGRPKLNPDYNPEIDYKSREDRQEWDAAGFMGIVRVKKGQPINDNWMFEKSISPSVDAYFIK